MQLLRERTLAALVPPLARVLLVGSGDGELEAGLAARGCVVRRYAGPGAADDCDTAVVVAFPSDGIAPETFLRNLARDLARDARAIFDSSRLAGAAVRATVLGGSVAAGTNGEVSETETLLYGRRSVLALVEEAGFTVLAGASDGILEAVPGGAVTPPRQIPAPSEADRLRYAEREVADLRAFFKIVHDGSRRLQEEIARTRAALVQRDVEIAKLREDSLANLGRETTDDDHDRTIALLRAQLESAEGRAADLEERLAGVRAALVELRDGPRAPQASTE